MIFVENKALGSLFAGAAKGGANGLPAGGSAIQLYWFDSPTGADQTRFHTTLKTEYKETEYFLPTAIARKQRLGVLHFGHSEYLYHSTPPIVVPFIHDHALSAQFDRWRKRCSNDLGSPVVGAAAAGGASLLQVSGVVTVVNGTVVAGLPDAEPVTEDRRLQSQSTATGPSVVPCYTLRKDVPFVMQASVRLDTLLRYLYLGVDGEYVVSEEQAGDPANTAMHVQHKKYRDKKSILSDAVSGFQLKLEDIEVDLTWKLRYAADADSNNDVLAGREVRTSVVHPQYEVTEFEADFAHGQSKGWETRSRLRSLLGGALNSAMRGALGGSDDVEEDFEDSYAYHSTDASDAGIE